MTTQRSQILQRREFTEDRTNALREALKDANARLNGRACVYATGSFGRLEANANSDLDVFIVGLNKPLDDNPEKSGRQRFESRLSNLDAICITADLIKVARQLDMPEFDGDGKYLSHYPLHDLIDTLGKPHDDASNTLTARLLLTLESRCLLGQAAYDEIIGEVVFNYWRDYEDHRDEYIPAFFANDILRLWRTFCVNYEARTKSHPDHEKIKRRIKNYKLKHSRMLTCFSALIHMLDIYKSKATVLPEDAQRMVALTPLERLEDVVSRSDDAELTEAINRALDCYDRFLETTASDDEALKERFADAEKIKDLNAQSNAFGDALHDVIRHYGPDNRFYRLLVV